jgi:hypothetical protein
MLPTPTMLVTDVLGASTTAVSRLQLLQLRIHPAQIVEDPAANSTRAWSAAEVGARSRAPPPLAGR